MRERQAFFGGVDDEVRGSRWVSGASAKKQHLLARLYMGTRIK